MPETFSYMKMLGYILISAPLLFANLRPLLAQGFVNLNFESAKIIPIAGSPEYPYGIETSNAVPGWTVYYGSNQVNQIFYNDPALGSTRVNLFATNGVQISGNFSLFLQGGLTESAATVQQSGLVPVSALSILFEAQPVFKATPGSLIALLGGQPLNYFVVSANANFTLYAADVSGYAGQTTQLAFSALHGPNNSWNLDNIQFSTSPIPEPSAFALVGVGGLLLALRLVHRQRAGPFLNQAHSL
jgi:hypothetical protein